MRTSTVAVLLGCDPVTVWGYRRRGYVPDRRDGVRGPGSRDDSWTLADVAALTAFREQATAARGGSFHPAQTAAYRVLTAACVRYEYAGWLVGRDGVWVPAATANEAVLYATANPSSSPVTIVCLAAIRARLIGQLLAMRTASHP